MFKISSTHHDVVVQGDTKDLTTAYLYTLSRSMLRVQRDSETMEIVTVIANGSGLDIRNQYYTDPEGRLEIPLRNIVNRFYEIGATFAITINFNEIDGSLADNSVIIIAEPVKGISYNEMLAPRQKDSPMITDEYRHDLILPPNVIINPNVGGQMMAGVLVETNYHLIENSASWELVSGVSTTPVAPSGDRSNRIVVGAFADGLALVVGKDNPQTVKVWKMEKPDVCTDLVVIRWTSLTGCMRQHFFPIIGYINEANEELSVVEAGNGYDIRKNAVKGIRCRLTGLTAYSCWYYQDLLQASDAHALVKQTEVNFATEIESMETACYVSGGMDTTPNGNGFFDFEFIVKLRHYDTF